MSYLDDHFFERTYKPFYSDVSDYETNAPSYYDALARQKEFLKLFTDKIIQLNNELQKEFDEVTTFTKEKIDDFQNRLDNIKEEMKEFFTEWINDGTIDDIVFKYITEEILKEKLDINIVYTSPENFGAKGDGITDDSIALQNCIDFAMDNNIRVLLTNDYFVSDSLITNKNVTIMGTGRLITDLINKPLIHHNGGVLRVQGIEVKQNSYSNATCIWVESGSLKAFSNTFLGNGYRGIVLSEDCDKSIIQANHFQNYFFMVSVEGAKDVVIDSNYFTGGVSNDIVTGGNGIKLTNDSTKSYLDPNVQASKRIIITKNTFFECLTDGIDAYTGGNDVVINNNLFINGGGMALEVKTIYRDLVQNGGTSIYEYRQAGNILFSQNIIKGFKNNMEVIRITNVEERTNEVVLTDRGVKSVTITENLFDDIVTGIYLLGCRDVHISNNQFKKVTKRVLTSAGHIEAVTFLQNTIRMGENSGTAIISLDSTNNKFVKINDNNIFGSSTPNLILYGLIISGENIEIKNNTLHRVANGIRLSNIHRVNISGNHFENITDIGFIFTTLVTNLIVTNNFFVSLKSAFNFGSSGVATNIVEGENVFEGVTTISTNEANVANLTSRNRTIFI